MIRVFRPDTPIPVLLDLETWVLYQEHDWHLRPDGYLASNRSRLPLHREAIRRYRGEDSNQWSVTDHINQNKLDNRLSNLRLVSKSMNALNSKKRNTRNGVSHRKGVSHSPRRSETMQKPWRSRIFIEGKEYSLGYFATEAEAAHAYDYAAAKWMWDQELPPVRPRRGRG